MSVTIIIIKTLYYLAFVCILSAYMSRTDIRIKDNYPNKDTKLFFLLKERMNQIDGQLPWLFISFGVHCFSLSYVVDSLFNVSEIISLVIAGGMFVLGVIVSLVFSKIKKSPIEVVYEHNDEEGLLNRVASLESLYNTSKYMIFGMFLLCFI